GYVLKTRPTNATGFFNNFPQSVTYVYSDRSSITENIGASSDPNTPTSSNTSNVNRPSKAPKYPIYNASTSSVEPEHINFRPASKDPSVNENNSKALPQTGNNKTEKTSLFGLGLLAILSSLTSGWFTHKRKEN
ncbi:MAG: LPXTG cell wall anchor domain-containing protein, partial [Lactobacillus sp.]|nr:LPXTG cell wall anchor domain-containing protein [Lactobacillus sp.]